MESYLCHIQQYLNSISNDFHTRNTTITASDHNEDGRNRSAFSHVLTAKGRQSGNNLWERSTWVRKFTATSLNCRSHCTTPLFTHPERKCSSALKRGIHRTLTQVLQCIQNGRQVFVREQVMKRALSSSVQLVVLLHVPAHSSQASPDSLNLCVIIFLPPRIASP